jgi:aminomethyltransferase
MGPFAGWEMPLSYDTPRAEHRAVRDRLGVFDVSHMGQIEVSGDGAAESLARALTNDIDALAPGRGQYTLMCADDGGVVDDLIVYRTAGRRFLLVVNAANIDACRDRLDALSSSSTTVQDRSASTAMLALQGRGWGNLADRLTGSAAELRALPYFGIARGGIAGVECLVARTGYTGEPGVEIMCDANSATDLWDALMNAPEAPAPVGLVARDTLRLEVGYPLYGNELSRERTPIEAGLSWACDLAGGRFAGADVLRRQAAEGTPERLTMLRLTEPGIPRAGHAVLDAGGARAGVVTSGTLSPVLDAGIGMAYVRAGLAAPGSRIAVDVRGTLKDALTAKRPLVDTSPKEA